MPAVLVETLTLFLSPVPGMHERHFSADVAIVRDLGPSDPLRCARWLPPIS